jgi:hypothetical protein
VKSATWSAVDNDGQGGRFNPRAREERDAIPSNVLFYLLNLPLSANPHPRSGNAPTTFKLARVRKKNLNKIKATPHPRTSPQNPGRYTFARAHRIYNETTTPSNPLKQSTAH